MTKKINWIYFLLIICLISGCTFFKTTDEGGLQKERNPNGGDISVATPHKKEKNADASKATLPSEPKRWQEHYSSNVNVHAKYPPLWNVQITEEGFSMQGPIPGAGTGLFMLMRYSMNSPINIAQASAIRRQTYKEDVSYRTELENMGNQQLLGNMAECFRYRRYNEAEDMIGTERVTVINGKVYIALFAAKPAQAYRYNLVLEKQLYEGLRF